MIKSLHILRQRNIYSNIPLRNRGFCFSVPHQQRSTPVGGPAQQNDPSQIVEEHSPRTGPSIDENGLYYGRFTKEEYEEASQAIQQQLEILEDNIKGTQDVRENLGKMPQFPARDEGGTRTISNLTDLFTQTIKTTGPMSLSAYMRQCLTHPKFGYYTTRDPLDIDDGDFITSPEISSVFGEMIGVWLFTVWNTQGRPSSIKVIEFGPGKGTLMHDVMNVFNKFVVRSGTTNLNIEINMIEASPVLRKKQWELLCGNQNAFETTEDSFNLSTTKWENTIKWLDTEKDIQHTEGVANYVLAHEFFDALPIKSFQRTEKGWRELLVEHTSSVVNTQPKLPDPEQESEAPDFELLDTKFHLTMSPKETPSSILPNLNKRFNELEVGSRIEVCSEAELYVMKMAQLLNNEKGLGSVLIIDYGLENQVPDNTLRGIYKHKFVSPFIKPGEVDLSIDVDFQNLVSVTSSVSKSFGPVEQGDWLHNLGIGYRVDQLIKKNAHDHQKQEKVYESYRRLTDKDDKSMGKIYKFLTLMPLDSSTPAGF